MNDLIPIETKTDIKKYTSQEKSSLEDFEKARKHITEIIDISKEAIQECLNVAKQGQLPSHYEALTNLIRETSDLASKLLSTHEQISKITGSKTSVNVQGNVFLTTQEVSKHLRELQNENS